MIDKSVARRAEWVVLLVVASAQFMAVMSTSAVSVALPTIGRDLDATSTSLEWVFDSYQLVFASLLVAGGVASDRLGRKGMFVLGVGLFGLGSLVDTLAPSVGWLIVGRMVQGLGPAIVAPTTLAIISATFREPRARARAISTWSAGSGLALALGPAVGGVLIHWAGWRAVFVVNLPSTALIMVLGARYLRRTPHVRPVHPFDWVGAVLTTVAVALLTFAAIEAQAHGWSSPLIIGALVAGVASVGTLIAWERRRPGALIDISLFRRAPYTMANVAAMTVFFAFVGVIVYLSAYFQQVQGRSALETGLCVIPLGLGFFAGAPLSGRAIGRVGVRPPMVGGLVLCGAATLALMRLQTHSSIASVWWNLLLVGLGAGLCLTPMTTTAVAAVGHQRAGMASAVHNSMRQFGQALGVAVLGALVYAGIPRGLVGGVTLNQDEAAAFVSGLHHALLLSGVCLLVVATGCSLAFRASLRP